MKKYFSSRIICIILAFSMLFANISFVFAEEGNGSSMRELPALRRIQKRRIYSGYNRIFRWREADYTY